jgi:membrane-associated phospholipid phosphatase
VYRLAMSVAVGVLAVVTSTLAVAWGFGRPLGSAVLLHGGVLALLVSVALRRERIRSLEAGALVTAVVVIGAMFFLYTSLGQVVFVAIPWNGDAALRAVDRALGLGVEPVRAVADRLAGAGWAIEPLAFFYAAFIPYLYLSIFLGLIGRPDRTRAVFVLGFALLYGASFMGYLFVPARGPIVAMDDVLSTPLDVGFFLDVVRRSIDLAGGPHGAFPSLHIGASCLAAIVDFRHGDKLRGLIYVPFVLLIAVATVALRYHYVVDLLAGACLAWAAVAVAERGVARASSSVSGGPT